MKGERCPGAGKWHPNLCTKRKQLPPFRVIGVRPKQSKSGSALERVSSSSLGPQALTELGYRSSGTQKPSRRKDGLVTTEDKYPHRFRQFPSTGGRRNGER